MGSRDFGGSDEIYNDAEVVLLDFSDKNIYEEMKRQDERRRAEQKKEALKPILSVLSLTISAEADANEKDITM